MSKIIFFYISKNNNFEILYGFLYKKKMKDKILHFFLFGARVFVNKITIIEVVSSAVIEI